MMIVGGGKRVILEESDIPWKAPPGMKIEHFYAAILDGRAVFIATMEPVAAQGEDHLQVEAAT